MEFRDYWAAEQRELPANFLAGIEIRGSVGDRCGCALRPSQGSTLGFAPASPRGLNSSDLLRMAGRRRTGYFGTYVFTTIPLPYATDFTSDSGVRCEKTFNPSPIAIGLTKKFSSSIRRFSISDDTNLAPP